MGPNNDLIAGAKEYARRCAFRAMRGVLSERDIDQPAPKDNLHKNTQMGLVGWYGVVGDTMMKWGLIEELRASLKQSRPQQIIAGLKALIL